MILFAAKRTDFPKSAGGKTLIRTLGFVSGIAGRFRQAVEFSEFNIVLRELFGKVLWQPIKVRDLSEATLAGALGPFFEVSSGESLLPIQ